MEIDRLDKRHWAGLIAAGMALLAVLFAFVLVDRVDRGPNPETIVATSLEAMQSQNRLVPFSARFVSVVTSKQKRLGLFEAERTLILPGTVRYEVDLSKLEAEDLDWDEATRTLRVTIPEVELAGPEVDLEATREYGETGILGAVTDAEDLLDDANRARAVADLRKQAGGSVPLGLARDAARDAIARNFLLPLRAAGMDDVNVEARFASDPSPSTEGLDVSTSYRDALDEAQRRRARTGE